MYETRNENYLLEIRFNIFAIVEYFLLSPLVRVKELTPPTFGFSRSNILVLYFRKEPRPNSSDPRVFRSKAAKRASPSAFLISSPTKEGRDARVARLGKDERAGA